MMSNGFTVAEFELPKEPNRRHFLQEIGRVALGLGSFSLSLRARARQKPRATPAPAGSKGVKKGWPDVVMVGAGAFGGWTAFHLLQHGARVTLLDAWGAGHLRGTSSGETRIIRTGYGTKPIYSAWAWRALQQWKHWERAWRTPLFVPSGVLWLAVEEDEYVRASLAAMEQLKVPHERLSAAELHKRYPQISTEGIRFGYLETQCGFLRARKATETVSQVVARSGGKVLIAAAEPPSGSGPRFEQLRLANGERLSAGHFVFACGPWLPELFPNLLSRRIRITKQDVFFFGLPPGDRRFEPATLPPWIELSQEFYGIPASDGRGLKVANDHSGPLFDPTRGERMASPENAEAARRYVAQRFPAMAGAPVVETRVCQYERTPDSHLVIDRHPGYENVWIVGGGSGHGFKLGPTVGEIVARQVLGLGGESIPAEMRLGAIAYPESSDLYAMSSF